MQFTAEFLNRRMREHQEWQERTAREEESLIILEVLSSAEEIEDYDGHYHIVPVQ
jgi:hypothetical protein